MKQQLLRPEIKPLLSDNNSLDIVRYYLSFAVLFAHFAELTASTNHFPTSSYSAVGAFFILSGFLVFYSYTRSTNITQYLIRRAGRILPPYITIIILCAIMGACITDLPLHNYITSSQLWQYLAANLTFANFLQPSLPGVFIDHTHTAVNGSLWTMKVEVLLYITLPLAATILSRYNKACTLITIYITSYLYKLWMGHLYNETGDIIYHIMQRQIGGQLLFFYSGVALLLYFDHLQRNIKWLFPIALTICFASKAVNWFEAIEPLSIAIVVIGFAYNCNWFTWLRKYNNIAYDIYLFHYPVIQLVIHWQIPQHSITLALITTIAITLTLSIITNHLIEQPFMHNHRKTSV